MRPQAVLADFQSIYASLLALERLPNGRYPERAVLDAYAMPLTEYTRRAIITGATARQLDVITTNSRRIASTSGRTAGAARGRGH